jgi:hypothetical protein
VSRLGPIAALLLLVPLAGCTAPVPFSWTLLNETSHPLNTTLSIRNADGIEIVNVTYTISPLTQNGEGKSLTPGTYGFTITTQNVTKERAGDVGSRGVWGFHARLYDDKILTNGPARNGMY